MSITDINWPQWRKLNSYYIIKKISIKKWIIFVLRKNHLKWIIFIENSTDRKICKFISFSITLGWVISLFYVNIVFCLIDKNNLFQIFFSFASIFCDCEKKATYAKSEQIEKKNIQFHIISIKLDIFYYMSDL